jgi:threonine dehydrogenase-like Zn-dependent dehydrogenase
MKSPSPATMKALVKEGPSVDALRIARWQMPVARAGEVVVRVGAVGICGTDLSLYHWYPEIVNVYDAKLPLVLGHEFSGHVAALGDGVLSCAIGTLVAVNPIITCGTCFHCGRGESNLCDRRVFIGGQRHGALAEYVAVPAEQVVPLPATIGTEVAALAEPFCVALHALERVPISARDVVAIVGARPRGRAAS